MSSNNKRHHNLNQVMHLGGHHQDEDSENDQEVGVNDEDQLAREIMGVERDHSYENNSNLQRYDDNVDEDDVYDDEDDGQPHGDQLMDHHH